MRRVLKIMLIIFLIIVSLIVIVTTVFYASLFLTHSNILETRDQNAEYYSNYSIEKSGFVLKTKVLEDDDIKSIAFTVSSSNENKVVFDSYNEENHYSWRLIDFKGIKFAEDSLDIIVESSDVGTYRFRFDENNWHLENTGDG